MWWGGGSRIGRTNAVTAVVVARSCALLHMPLPPDESRTSRPRPKVRKQYACMTGWTRGEVVVVDRYAQNYGVGVGVGVGVGEEWSGRGVSGKADDCHWLPNL